MIYGTTELPYTAARIKGIIKATGQITVKPAGLAGIQLDCNGATGDFTASITPANLTGNRRWILPNRDDTFAGVGAQTFTGAQVLSDSTASTSPTTGALVVTTGGVGVGGRLNVGGATTFLQDVTVDKTGANSQFWVKTDDANQAGFAFYNRSVSGLLLYRPAGVTSLSAFSTGASADVFSISNSLLSSGSVRVLYSTASTSPANGALVVIGGAGIGGALNVGGALEVSSATLIKSNTTLTDGAAAAVGTLTNAPTAGNPTKWVLINDNGVIRKFPTWT